MEITKKSTYVNLAGFGPDLITIGFSVLRLQRAMERSKNKMDYEESIEMVEGGLDQTFKEYIAPVDEKMFAVCMAMLYEGTRENLPEFFKDKTFRKAKGETVDEKCRSYAATVFEKSILVDRAKLEKFLSKPSLKKLKKDPGMEFINRLIEYYRNEIQRADGVSREALREKRNLLMEGLLEMGKDKKFYPDANSTLRYTYGTVQPFKGWDGKDRQGVV